MSDRLARTLATLALAASLVAVVLAGYTLHAQQRAEQDLREIARELQRAVAPRVGAPTVLPMGRPPMGLDPDDT